MITKKYGNNYVCYSICSLKNDEISDFFKGDLNYFFKKFKKPIILVLGGDGTMLSAIRKHYKKNIDFLGVNFGNTGFLLNNKKTLNDFSGYIVRKYPLLDVSYNFDGKKYSGVCFNEVNITVSNGKVLELFLDIGGEEVFLRGDGVLIVTPAGSTAYNKSLYGPIIPEKSKSFIMTPKADINHKKPIIFKDNKKVTVENINRFNPFKVYLDSNLLGKEILDLNTKIKVKKSDYNVNLISLKN